MTILRFGSASYLSSHLKLRNSIQVITKVMIQVPSVLQVLCSKYRFAVENSVSYGTER
jgi:hypothetical protein